MRSAAGGAELTSAVERRRRETINEGINELAKIVPGSEKNKGSILQGAVTYINELRAKESLVEEKKAMEKSVMDQALQDLMQQIQSYKERNENLEIELMVKRETLDRRDEAIKQKDEKIRALKKKLARAGLDGDKD